MATAESLRPLALDVCAAISRLRARIGPRQPTSCAAAEAAPRSAEAAVALALQLCRDLLADGAKAASAAAAEACDDEKAAGARDDAAAASPEPVEAVTSSAPDAQPDPAVVAAPLPPPPPPLPKLPLPIQASQHVERRPVMAQTRWPAVAHTLLGPCGFELSRRQTIAHPDRPGKTVAVTMYTAAVDIFAAWRACLGGWDALLAQGAADGSIPADLGREKAREQLRLMFQRGFALACLARADAFGSLLTGAPRFSRDVGTVRSGRGRQLARTSAPLAFQMAGMRRRSPRLPTTCL